MPGTLYPIDGPRPADSDAERTLYSALARGLPRGWTAWHSLRLRVGSSYEGEGDFVVAIPDRGLLVIEVKGGQIEIQRGRWLQNGRPMPRAPLDQARGFVAHLADVLRSRRGGVPPYGAAVAFPHCAFSVAEEPTESGVRGRVIGARDLDWLERALPALADQVLPSRPVPPAREWIPIVHELWCETWVPHVRLCDSVEDAARKRIALDVEQLRLLDLFDANPRALVEGGAGSGKTVVARELCRRRAAAGRRVWYVCYTDALGRAVDDYFAPWRATGLSLRAAPVRRLARSLLEAAGRPVPDDWEEVSLHAACDALPAERPELVVVDEAQDFGTNDFALVEALAAGGELWALQDPKQRFWSDRVLPAEPFAGSARLRLPGQRRNPPAIEWFAMRYAGQTATPPPDLSALRVVSVAEGQVIERARHELSELRRAGVAPGDIAVLTLAGRERSGLRDLTELGSHRVVTADATEAGSQIVADTVIRFKGLERPFVILVEVEPESSAYDVRMHIGATRATVGLLVVCTKAASEQDARLR